jgi:hypothetical protein
VLGDADGLVGNLWKESPDVISKDWIAKSSRQEDTAHGVRLTRRKEMSLPTSELRGFLAESAKALRTLNRLVMEIEALEKAPVDNVYQIEEQISKVRKLLASFPPDGEIRRKVESWLSDRTSRLQCDKDELKRVFGIKLESALAERGLKLEGHYPDLKAGFYIIETDFDKGQATIWYGPKQEQISKTNLSASEVAKQVERIGKALTDREFDEEGFLKRLHEAYLCVASRMGLKEGDRVPILQLLLEYVFLEQDRRFRADPKKEYFKGYGRVFFSYDLYRLQRRRWQDKELCLVVAARADTVKRESFLWVPDDDKGNGTIYAYLYFRKVQ